MLDFEEGRNQTTRIISENANAVCKRFVNSPSVTDEGQTTNKLHLHDL